MDFLHKHCNSNCGTKTQYEHLVSSFSVHLSQTMAVQVLDRCRWKLFGTLHVPESASGHIH